MNIKNIVLFSALLVTVVAILYSLSYTKAPVTQQTNKVSVSQIHFFNICDCYILAGDGAPTFAIDSKTEKPVTFSFLPKTGQTDDFFIPTLSPSGRSVVAFLHSATSLVYFETVESADQVLYTTQGDETLAWVTWSADEQYVVVGLQTPADYQPSEGTWPTTIKTFRVRDGQEQMVLTRDQILNRGIQAIYPMAVTAGAKKILFMSGDMGNPVNWVWSMEDGLKKINQLLPAPTYQTVARIGKHPVHVTLLEGNLHLFDVEQENNSLVSLTTWSDSPLSPLHPDGKSVMYLKRNSERTEGILTLLDLETQEEQQILSEPLGSNGSLLGSFWSPDGKYFIFNKTYQSAGDRWAVRTDRMNQNAELIKSPKTLDRYNITTMVAKPGSGE